MTIHTQKIIGIGMFVTLVLGVFSVIVLTEGFGKTFAAFAISLFLAWYILYAIRLIVGNNK